MHRSLSGRRTPPGRGPSLHQRVRTAKRRKPASTRWLERQLNDPYVAQAKRDGYRSRAAYKLVEIDDRFQIFRAGCRVLDLGCAPGGWSQVAVRRGADTVVGVDLHAMVPIAGVTAVQGDFNQPDVRAILVDTLGGVADCVLSDMAAAATGHRTTDRIRVAALAEDAAALAMTVLAPGGTFIAKVLRAGVPDALRGSLTERFRVVRHCKPTSSRAESDEIYVVAMGFGEKKGMVR